MPLLSHSINAHGKLTNFTFQAKLGYIIHHLLTVKSSKLSVIIEENAVENINLNSLKAFQAIYIYQKKFKWKQVLYIHNILAKCNNDMVTSSSLLKRFNSWNNWIVESAIDISEKLENKVLQVYFIWKTGYEIVFWKSTTL